MELDSAISSATSYLKTVGTRQIAGAEDSPPPTPFHAPKNPFFLGPSTVRKVLCICEESRGATRELGHQSPQSKDKVFS